MIKTDNPQLDLGALRLVRERGTPQKIFGYNEGKIVQTFVAGDSDTNGGPWTRARRNDNLFWGVAAPARAEAWEFMLNQGGAVDHFGYRYALDNSRALQGQMRQLLLFLRKLRLTELKRSSVPSGSVFTTPTWLAGWPAYPVGPAGFDSATKSQKFWAALEPSTTASKRQFVLYVHNSVPRCRTGEYTASGCTGTSPPFLSFGGIDTRAWSDDLRYEENLDLRLGGPSASTYLLEWFIPPTAGELPVASTSLHWTPNGTGGSCLETLTPGRCVVRSPRYEYDLAVKITEQ